MICKYNSSEVSIHDYGFGNIVTFDRSNPSCPGALPSAGDVFSFEGKDYRVDFVTDFGDSADVLCFEVNL